MSSKVELKYGFWDKSKVARKVATIKVKLDSIGGIADLFLIQHDIATLFHYSLHNVAKSEKPKRYHMQCQDLGLITSEDQSKFPDILETDLPNFENMKNLWPLQAVPFWPYPKEDNYNPMTGEEIDSNREHLADFGKMIRDSMELPGAIAQIVGSLETFLVAPGNTEALERKKSMLKKKLRCWNVYTGTRPWILGYITLSAVSRKMLSSHK